jgi:hypothetical protein
VEVRRRSDDGIEKKHSVKMKKKKGLHDQPCV